MVKAFEENKFIPLNATFELTPFCNFKCKMCYIRLTKEQAEKQGYLLTKEEWLKIAHQAKDIGVLKLSLTGGEPFTYPDFWELYSELNKMGFLISILSNGSLINEDVIEKLREYGMPFSMKITVYGASNETYCEVCGDENGFDKMSTAIDLLIKEGVPLSLTSTIVKENACDLQAIYDFARLKGLPMQHTISVVKSARGAENTTEKSRFALSDFPDEITLEQLEKNKFPPYETPFARCSGYNNSIWITWNGNIQLCSFMNTPCVKYSGSLADDYKNLHGLLAKIKNPNECEKCAWKAFCQRCPGILCAESGHPEKIDKGLCDMAKKLFELYEQKKRVN